MFVENTTGLAVSMIMVLKFELLVAETLFVELYIVAFKLYVPSGIVEFVNETAHEDALPPTWHPPLAAVLPTIVQTPPILR